MYISYNRLWKLLIDKGMMKKELSRAADISPSLVAKLGRNENVTIEVLAKICVALECNFDEIMEIVSE